MPRILVVKVGKNPEVSTIKQGLEPMQEVVGGLIEAVGLEDQLDIFCNEEGHLLHLPFNRDVGRHHIMGDFFVSRSNDDGETIDLTDADVEKYTKEFAL